MKRKKFRILLASLLILCLFLVGISAFFVLNSEFYYTSDAAKYILLGRSIAQGKGYSSIWEISPLPHVKYSPLLPLLVSPFHSLSHASVLSIKIFIKVLSICSVLSIFFYLIYRKTGVLAAGVITAIHIIPFSFFLYSEGPNPAHLYTFISFLALWRMEVFLATRDRIVMNGIVASLLCALCFFSKGNGIALIIAGCAALFLKRNTNPTEHRKRVMVFLMIAVIPLLLWFARSYTIGSARSGYGFSYTAELLIEDIRMPLEEIRVGASGLFGRMFDNLLVYLDGSVISSDNLVRRLVWPSVWRVLHVVVAYLWGVGIWRSFKRDSHVVALYCVFYLGILLMWPWQGQRMYLPIRPLVVYFTCLGMLHYLSALKQMSSRWGLQWDRIAHENQWRLIRITCCVLLLFVVGFSCYRNIREIKRAYSHKSPEYIDFIEASEWIQENTAASATFSSSIAPACSLYARRPASYPRFTMNGNVVLQQLYADNIDYVMLQRWGNDFSYSVVLPVIVANRGKFIQVFENKTCKIFKVLEAAATNRNADRPLARGEAFLNRSANRYEDRDTMTTRR